MDDAFGDFSELFESKPTPRKKTSAAAIAAEAAGSSDLLDLIAKGRKEGYVTLSDVDNMLPQADDPASRLEEILAELNEAGYGADEFKLRYSFEVLRNAGIDSA
mgnify:CR=1 FL=1